MGRAQNVNVSFKVLHEITNSNAKWLDGGKKLLIAQFRYINIQLQTIDFSTRLWGINYRVCGVYSPKPCGDVFCFKLNFKISKLAY